MSTDTLHTITTTRPTVHSTGYPGEAELLCSVCGDPVRHAPPDYYLTSDPDRVPRYSHHDGTSLCFRPDGGGPAAPRPREVRLVAGQGWAA